LTEHSKIEIPDKQLNDLLVRAFRLDKFCRGFAVEDALGSGSLPRNYPSFDLGFHSKGIGLIFTSIKSRDCRARTYASSSNFIQKCRKDVDSVATFVSNPFWVHRAKKMTILNFKREEIGQFRLTVVALGLERYGEFNSRLEPLLEYANARSVVLRLIAVAAE
jgi:hypothetical protein